MKRRTRGVILSAGLFGVLVGCGKQAEFAGDAGQKPMVQQTGEKEVVFGEDKVFHIGDGKYPDSTCKDQIEAYQLSGNKYFFEFEVLNPQTLLEINIRKVCGVDYQRTNSTRIMMGEKTLEPLTIEPHADHISFKSLKLDPGKYAVVVESAANMTEVSTGDHDDFLVGNIHLKASKKIVGGTVRTE